MSTIESYAEEVQRLRNTMRDLVTLSTLPTAWARSSPELIVQGLAESLQSMLNLDLIYIQIRDGHSGGHIEFARDRAVAADASMLRTIGGALAPWLASGATKVPATVIDPLGGRELDVAVARFGEVGNEGAIVACASKDDFPTESDQLLLTVAMNQAMTVLERQQAQRAVAEERKRLQAALAGMTGHTGDEVAQGRLAAIVESSHDAILSKSLDGIILSWNAGAERLFDYTPAEAIGRHISLIIPPERQEEEHEILARIVNGERVDHFETVRVSKHGRLMDISLTISPIRDSAGHIIGASKVARDISDRKRIEQALRDDDRRKDEFIALLAHELRGPLAPLRNGLQVMRLGAADAAAVAQARGMMERQLGHLIRLVDDLLDISRIGQNKMELRRTRVFLADIVSSAVETARPALESAGHQLTISLPPEPVSLDADLTRLAQVFSNLLTNSAKYTERGGHIWLTAERKGDDVSITVRDTGIGIPEESLPRIFDMFSQVDRSIERATGGLGIGLALVKGLVEMHEGTVTAASAGLGKGCTFTVTLPVLRSPTTSPLAVPSDNARAAGPKWRILVVDDNRDSATSMAMMLKLMGNETWTAHDGIEAIDAAEKVRPHVILMDVGMPRLNGYDATRRIREQPWGESLAVIALTGWGQPDDKVRSRAAGCNGHLVKPVNLSELEKLLATLTDEVGNQE